MPTIQTSKWLDIQDKLAYLEILKGLASEEMLAEAKAKFKEHQKEQEKKFVNG